MTKNIKKNSYLILPIASLFFWALYALIVRDFYQVKIYDFECFYYAGKMLQTAPEKLYHSNGYFYSPFYAMIFSFTLSNLELRSALFIGFAVNIILGIIMIFEFDKLLKLLNVNDAYRLIFLLIIFNGWKIYSQFYMVQSKILSALCLIIVVRREIKWKISFEDKDLKFYCINYFLLLIIMSVAPYYVFFLIIYIIHQMKGFGKLNRTYIYSLFKHFLLIGIIFSLQNIVFFMYPNTILDFLNKGTAGSRSNTLYLYEGEGFHRNFALFMNVLLLLFTLYIANKEISIEFKYGYSSLAILLLGTFGTQQSMLNLLPFLLILIIPYLEEFELSKNNLPIFIFLFSVFLFNFVMPFEDTYFKYIPFLKYPPYIYAVYLRWVFVIILLNISLIWIIKINKKMTNKMTKRIR